MNKSMKYLILAILLIVVAASPVSAQGGENDGQVVFGGTYTLRSGETLRGDLAIFGGEATIEEGAEVEGDVVAFGGRVAVAGRITGDLVSFGGAVRLTSSAEVFGDLAGFGQITQEPGAVVHGTTVEGFRFKFDAPEFSPRLGFVPFDLAGGGVGVGVFAIVMRILRTLITVLAVTAIAALATVFLPEQTRQVGEAARQSFAPSLGMGCLILVLCPLIAIVLVLTIVGIFALPFLFVALAVALLFGWVGVGLVVGERVLQAVKLVEVPPIVSAIVGVLLISMLAVAPACIGPLFTLVVGSIGLGAVLLTRFGTQTYVPGSGSMHGPPVPSQTQAANRPQ